MSDEHHQYFMIVDSGRCSSLTQPCQLYLGGLFSRSLGILEVYIRQLLNAGNDTSCSMSGVKSVNDAESYVSSLKLAPYVHVEHRPGNSHVNVIVLV